MAERIALRDDRGIGTFAEAGDCGCEAGQKIPARGSALFAGQRPRAAKKPERKKIFVTFYLKSNSHPRQ